MSGKHFLYLLFSRYLGICTIIFLLLFLNNCSKKSNETASTGRLKIQFAMQVEENDLIYNQLLYSNAAGNQYEVREVKFYVSDFIFYSHTGNRVKITSHNGVHYYDSNIESTYLWDIFDKIPTETYDSVSFIFGLLPERNVTGSFPNPPENLMAWPEVLGGGYHYMQINGKWLNQYDSLMPFNLHTGIGQLRQDGQIYDFVHNQFQVTLPLSSFKIKDKQIQKLVLVMNVNQWFNSPNVFDFNYYGGAIMQNQEAQQVLKENGHNVFTAHF